MINRGMQIAAKSTTKLLILNISIQELQIIDWRGNSMRMPHFNDTVCVITSSVVFFFVIDCD